MARDDAHDALRDILMRATLHTWASLQPGARAMRGRGTTWATALPSGQPVAVRHSLHGGILAAITRDLFLDDVAVGPTFVPADEPVAVELVAESVADGVVVDGVVRALPALRNPTISQLSSPDWIALETIIDESVAREIIPQLKALGAEGIVEYPLNKVVY